MNFYKKMFRLDITKDWYSYISESESEWLVMDLANNRYTLYKYGDSIFTTGMAQSVYDLLPNKSESPEITKLINSEIIEPLDIEERVLEGMFRDFFKLLLKRFREDRIIILIAENTCCYIDPESGSVAPAVIPTDETARRQNEYMSVCNKYTYKFLPRAHYVALPTVLFGSTRHKWGKCSLHYVDETYSYIYRCFDYIMTSKVSRAVENQYIASQREYYSKLIFNKYTALIGDFINHGKNILLRNELADCKAYSQNGLTLTMEADFRFSLRGKATKDTVFYISSESKNPLGGWKCIEKTTRKGSYSFSTNVKSSWPDCYVQLVIRNTEEDTRWITGDYTVPFNLDKDYKYRLIRIVVAEGRSADMSGRFFLAEK